MGKAKKTIEELLEASSFGTPEAKALRATVSPEQAKAVVERAKQLREERRRAEWDRKFEQAAAARRVDAALAALEAETFDD